MILLWNSADMLVTLDLIDGDTRANFVWQADRELAHGMLAYLRDRLAEYHWTLNDITGIGVMKGPGSYTGLRIGLTVLNTIATDRQIPIVGETGQYWRETCLERLERGEDDRIVLPKYGGEVHITTPRK